MVSHHLHVYHNSYSYIGVHDQLQRLAVQIPCSIHYTRKSLLQSIFELHEEFADFLSCSVPGTYQFDTVEASVGVIY